MALLENRKSCVDYKLIQAAVGTGSIAIRDVVKPDTDVYRAALGSKYSYPTTGLSDKCELTRVFNRNRLVEV
jgi:hypothetical protein